MKYGLGDSVNVSVQNAGDDIVPGKVIGYLVQLDKAYLFPRFHDLRYHAVMTGKPYVPPFEEYKITEGKLVEAVGGGKLRSSRHRRTRRKHK